MTRQVTCIHKLPNHYAAHERIQSIGGTAPTVWQHTEAQAIRNIQTGVDSYYVSKNGRTVRVIVANHLGRPYLKTEADGYSPDNLLALPECP
jgi:hypothetical protein